jgi:hypothetical protein
VKESAKIVHVNTSEEFKSHENADKDGRLKQSPNNGKSEKVLMNE